MNSFERITSIKSNERTAKLKIVHSLTSAFIIERELEVAICSDQKAADIDDAVSKWLNGILLLAEPQIASLLMPIIAQRFDVYINQLRRTSPWLI